MSHLVMIGVEELVRTVFSGLSALVIEDVKDAGDTIIVRTRTRDEPVACPGCGVETARGRRWRKPAGRFLCDKYIQERSSCGDLPARILQVQGQHR
jgi:hypothetical protein